MREWVLKVEKNEKETILFMLVTEGIEENASIEIENKINQLIDRMDEREWFLFNENGDEQLLYHDYWKKTYDKKIDEFITLFSRNYTLSYENVFMDMITFSNGLNEYKLKISMEIQEFTKCIVFFHLLKVSTPSDNLAEGYDNNFEKLKNNIKSFWIKGLGKKSKIYLMMDTQSEDLAKRGYEKIYVIENRLRVFINTIMIYKEGIDWHKIFDDESFQNKVHRNIPYKKDVTSFNNIDDFLLAMDADDLSRIMCYKQSYLQIDGENHNFGKMISELINKNKDVNLYFKQINKLIDELKKHLKININMWDRRFSDLFDLKDEENLLNNEGGKVVKSQFLKNWDELCKMRNHIAHNKFIDYNFFSNLEILVGKVESEIQDAEDEFFAHKDDNSYDTRNYQDLDGSYYSKYFQNRIKREYTVYLEICHLLFNVLMEISKCNNIEVKLDLGFTNIQVAIDETGRDFISFETKYSKDDFFDFYGNVKNGDFNLEILSIKNNYTLDKMLFILRRNRGEEKTDLTSYTIEVTKMDGSPNLISDIGHDGYSLRCSGVDEDHYFVGGNWSSFNMDVINRVYYTFINRPETEEEIYESINLSKFISSINDK